MHLTLDEFEIRPLLLNKSFTVGLYDENSVFISLSLSQKA